MNLPDLAEALQMTWPAASVTQQGPWLIRDGAGAGRRASAATPIGPVSEKDIAQAEEAMLALPMAPLFGVRVDQPEYFRMGNLTGCRESVLQPFGAAGLWPPAVVRVLRCVGDWWDEPIVYGSERIVAAENLVK